jgi:8-oxo-dGTP pyrophosphatase MutT (NUDIX family)
MDPSQRHHIPQHFTASGVVISQQHVLLVHHKRIGAWLPPGGHIEDFEMPEETAVREILEETGVRVEVICDPLPDTGSIDGFFLKSPLCIHAVQATEGGQDLYHLDLAYLCRPLVVNAGDGQRHGLADSGLPALRHNQEVKAARWVSLNELDSWHLARNVREAIDLAKARLGLSDR